MATFSKFVCRLGALTKQLPSVQTISLPTHRVNASRSFASRSALRQRNIPGSTITSVSNLQSVTKRVSDLPVNNTSTSIEKAATVHRDKIFNDISKPLMTSHSKKASVEKHAQFSIRQMEKEDLPHLYQMLDEHGWIMEKAYLECAFITDPSGFFVAVTDEEEIIGSHGFLSHCRQVATAGLWMVKQSYRNSNVGFALFEEMSRRLGNQNCGTFLWPYYLDKIKENYGVKYGIQPTKTYMTWYNHGRIEPRTCADSSNADVEITCLKDADMNELLEYDTKIHTVPRELYMKNWIYHERSKTYIAKRKDTVVGYGVLRSQDHYNQIAPLYAEDKGIAKALFGALGAEVPKGEKVGFSSPFENSSATEFSAMNKMMKPGIPLMMLYKDSPVNVDTNKVFAVSSNSFGTC